MAKQLVFTSALRGLDPGRSGYCTVARHRDLRERLLAEVERLSAYHHLNYVSAGRVVNPVVMAFRTLSLGDVRYHVLTRITDAGADYSRRSNYLAHHLIIEEKEITGGLSPADVFLGWNGWLDAWTGEPRFYGAAEEVSLAGLAAGLPSALPAKNWEALAGDAGAAAAPLDTAPRQGFAFSVLPGSERVLISLYRESAALLPPQERWKTGFTSFLQETDRQNDFRWIGHWPDHQPFNAGGWTILDLRREGLVTAPAGAAADRARGGEGPGPVPSKASAPVAPAAAGAVSKKWDVAKPGAGTTRSGSAPATKAAAFAREAAPAQSRRKWPLRVAGAVALLCAAGAAGYFLVQKQEDGAWASRDKARKDPFAGRSLDEKTAELAPKAAGPQPVPPPAVPSALPTPRPDAAAEEVVRSERSAAPAAIPLAREAKTYVAWRKSGAKLPPAIFDEAGEKAGPVKLLKDSGRWSEARAVKDENGLKIGPAEDVDGYNILIKDGRIDSIPTSLCAIEIGTARIVFIPDSGVAQGVWPKNPELALALGQNKAAKEAGLSQLALSGSGDRPAVEYRFPTTKEFKDAYGVLAAADAIADGAALRAAFDGGMDAGHRVLVISAERANPEKLVDARGIGAALEGYERELKKLNRAGDYLELQREETRKMTALKKSVALPVSNEEATLRKLMAINLTDDNTSWELGERVIEIVLGGDYGTIPLSREDETFTIEEVLKKAEDLYKRSSKKDEQAKAIIAALAAFFPPKTPVTEKFARSLTWIKAVKESIIEADKAAKAYEAAKKATADYDKLKAPFEQVHQYWRDVRRGEVRGGEIYLVMEDGPRIKLGPIERGAVK